MSDFLLKEVATDYIESELEHIGFDKAYKAIAADKFRYKNIKIFGLTVAQANILKQTALTFGADCAVNRNVIIGTIEKSDAILCGSYSQLKKIAQKLKAQPFKLPILGDEITEFLKDRKETTKIAGILNITPDSFSDGGMYFKPIDAEKHLIKLIEDGADLIDIGAESTRPFAEAVSAEEQIIRLKPVLEFINKENIDIPVSIDTRDSKVAEFVLENGANIINDVSGFDFDNEMPKIIAKYNAGVIIQHSKEKTESKPYYENIIDEVCFCLKNKIETAEKYGINNIIIDPGIGFGKAREDNFIILDRVKEFFFLNKPIMVGVSRKSLLGVKENDNYLKDTLSCALAYPLVTAGVDYLRVHNVKLHKKMSNSFTHIGNL